MATRFTDVSKKPKKMLAPIQGYQHKPLVSLEEAVQPVENIVSDVHRMAWAAKQRCCTPAQGLTSDESASIALYSMEWEPFDCSLYYILNNVLRSESRTALKPWFLYLKLFLTGLYKLPSIKGIVYRGVNGDLSSAYSVGQTIVWWGLSSCSSSLKIIEEMLSSGERTVFIIECLNGKDIREHSYYETEHEVMLLAGTSLKVVGQFKSALNLTIIQLKETEPLYPLVAPPFELEASKTTITANVSKKITASDSSQGITDNDTAQQNQRIIRYSDISEEMQHDIDPSAKTAAFTDSDNVPLVSLEKAVEPLRSFLSNIDYYAEEAKRKCESIHVLGLSQDQIASIMIYTMEWTPRNKCLYYALNSTLRLEDGKKLKPWLLYLRLIFTALSVLPCFRKTVYRGIKKDISKEYPIGSTFVWWGFSSCTTTVTTLEAESLFGTTGTRTLFHIECETGKNIQHYSAYKNENEILIPAGTQFTVVAVLSIPPDVHIVQVKEVRSSLFSNLSNVSVYQNLRLEQLIDQYEDVDSDLNLSDFGEINSADMAIIVDRALKQKQCSAIYLGNNKITSEGARILADGLNGNTSLKEIYLSNNQINNEGAKYIARALTSQNLVSSITSLNIGNAEIGDNGASYLARLLRVNTTLTYLNLWKNNLSDRGVIFLAQALIQNSQSKLANLNLSYNKSISDGCIDVLIELVQQTHTLKDLNLDGNKISRKGTKLLQKVATIKNHFICRMSANSSENNNCNTM